MIAGAERQSDEGGRKLLPVLGVDGAHDGGAVLLGPGGRKALGWGWRRRERKSGTVYLLRAVLHGEPHEDLIPSLHGVACAIVAGLSTCTAYVGGGCLLVVEDLYVPRPTAEDLETQASMDRYLGRVRSTQTLAEAVGELVGPLREGAVGEVRRVRASTWRKGVLGSGALSSSQSEELAIELCSRGRSPLVDGLGQLAQDPHVAESACIARWGWLQQLAAVRS